MSVTIRTDHPAAKAMDDANTELARRLWLIWARESDAVAKAMRIDSLDEEWLAGVSLIEEAALGMGAEKTSAVAAKARAMTTGAEANRALAIKAFRVAARLDFKRAAPPA